ncbi:MAG: DNA polymerase, partial [Candidatus Acidiferrales bacterium]
ARMMKYNCKDTTVTYEIYQRQEEEFDERPKLREYYYRHELPLARAMHRIEQRGLLMDTTQLSSLRKFIENELDSSCSRIGKSVNKPCYSGAKTAARAGYKKPGTYLNTGSPKQIADLLTSIGLKLPKNRGTGNVTTNEEALNRLYAESGNNILKELLLTRETSKLLNTYVNQELKNDISYTCYLVGGTVSGRRASAASPLGNGKRNLGTNHQNIPKHYELAERLRCCYISRPNYIFVMCDQVGAEDWIIQGLIADLTGDTRGLQELRDNIDRHQKLASIIFGVPLDQCSKSAHTNFRYIGKRVRYAGSYGMGASKFSAVLAKEGFAVSETDCDFLLRKFHEAEPSVKQVFQQYIEHTITKERRLDNLFGRQRQVFGLHPHRDNSKIFRELYSYIPQGTVGDNTGEAVLMVDAESTPRCYCVAEIHDAIALEVFDEDNDVFKACNLLQRSFDRKIRFPKGLELTIPIEFEIGYNLQDTIKCDSSKITSLTNISTMLVALRKARQPIISGQLQPQSQPA